MSAPPENPVYDAVLAYQKTAALIAALKLDLFTLIGAGTMTVDALIVGPKMALHLGVVWRSLRGERSSR